MQLQAPFENILRYSHIQDSKRRTYAGVVSSLDDSIGRVVQALNSRGFLQNSIIVFVSDNGGETNKNQKGSASNWPLRGQRMNSFEGAIRVPSFIWSPLLGLQEPRTSMQLMHITDWLPTLYSLIGDTTDLGQIDGLNMWPTFLTNAPSPRIEILHNIDRQTGSSSLRRGDYKLIVGTASGDNDLWYGPLEDMEIPASMDEWIFKNNTLVKNILQDNGLWLPMSADLWRLNLTINCGQQQPTDDGGCDPNKQPCLFNVVSDPCEYNNLAAKYPRVLKSMLEILHNTYEATIMEPYSTNVDLQADPRCHSFAFVSWLDDMNSIQCPFI